MSADRLADLSAAGVSIWLDDLDRGRLTGGGLAALVDGSHVVGVTTNPAIFEKAIVSGADEYAAQVHDLAIRGVSLDEAVRSMTTFDVRWACDVLAPVHARTGGVDGRVSIEVDPRLAADTEATVAEAKALSWAVDRPNLLVKIPATVQGLPAITEVLGAGISVNVTLIFSVDRYKGVLDAWLAGLELAQRNGHDLSTIESVASFFVSRVDSEVDKRLPADSPLRGTAAIANAVVAHEAFAEVVGSDRWKALAAAGAHVQRPLWASTGVKDPAYDDTRYVVELVTADTVNTMPEATLDAVRDHGVVRGDTVVPNYAAAHEALAALTAAGIDLDDVVQVLEIEGVDKFVQAWNQLLDAVTKSLADARAAAGC
jgi:transaldolase